MKRQAVFLMVLSIVMSFWAGCGESELGKAQRRVRGVLKNLLAESRNNENHEETAICIFYANKYRLLDSGDFRNATDAFDRWRHDAGIYPTIKSFEITGCESIDGGCIVRGVIEGYEFKINVPSNDDPLSWEQNPRIPKKDEE